MNHFSCRGYVSQSEQWRAGQRFLDQMRAGKRVVVLHLGDHDPSGIDMTRDITDRLTKFAFFDWVKDHREKFAEYEGGVGYSDIATDIADHIDDINPGDALHSPLQVERIALNYDQVERYDPPPNPAKLTDARASSYIDEYGPESWELDALPPDVLAELIQEHIDALTDHDRLNARIAEQEEGRRRLLKLSSTF